MNLKPPLLKMHSKHASKFKDVLSRNSVCVVGLGYIGLPTAAVLANRGYSVHGVDINPKAVETINQGQMHIVEPSLDMFVHAAVEPNLDNQEEYGLTSVSEAIALADVVFLVPHSEFYELEISVGKMMLDFCGVKSR